MAPGRNRNTITLIGALAEPALLTAVQAGLPRALFTLSATQATTAANGQGRTVAWRHRLSVIGEKAELVASLEPGTLLLAEGTLRSRDKNEQDGSRRHRIEVYGHQVEPVTDNRRLDTDFENRLQLQGGTNRVTLSGNLTRDLEIRYTGAGVPVLRGTLATNITITPNDRETLAQFIPVILWGDLAERHQYLRKGDGMYLQGMYLPDNFTTRSGEKVYRTVVEAKHAYSIGRLNRQESRELASDYRAFGT